MARVTGYATCALILLLAISGTSFAVPQIGTHAPNFTLPTETGTFTLSSCWGGSGKVVVLDFWATWCGHCTDAIPGLVAITNDYKSRGVMVVGVAIDHYPSTAYDYADDNDINYTICSDPDFLTTDVYNSGGIPQCYVIDRAGIVRFAQTGYSGEDSALRGALDTLTVPEPSSVAALLMGIAGSCGLVLRRRRA